MLVKEVHIPTKEPCVSVIKRDLYLHTKNPIFPSYEDKRPIFPQKPYLSAKERYVFAKWPCTSAKEPCMSAHRVLPDIWHIKRARANNAGPL